MLLDLGKAISFFLSIMSLYVAAISAFFAPPFRWEDRLLLDLPNLAIAACLCFASGLLFSWPSPANPEADQPLLSTLPVRLFFWSLALIAILFAASWYLRCGNPAFSTFNRDCAA